MIGYMVSLSPPPAAPSAAKSSSTTKPLRLPRQRVAKRNARKEELVKCVLAPRRPPHHPPRDGSCKLAEDPSVPEGQAKSEQAPIRRPPSRAEGHCTGARLAPFSLPPGAAHSLFGQDQKENGGRIPRGNGPLREQNPPWPPSGGPSSPKAGDLLRSSSPRPAPADSASIP